MSDPQPTLAGAAGQKTAEVSMVDEMLKARVAPTRERAKDLIKEFTDQVMQGAMTVSDDTEAMIKRASRRSTGCFRLQLNEIMHHPNFQKLEARGAG